MHFYDAGSQATFMESFRQLHTNKASTDDYNISYATLGNCLVHCFNVPREPEAVNTLHICVGQRQFHRSRACTKDKHVVAQNFFFTSFHISNSLSITVNGSYITACSCVNTLNAFEEGCITGNALGSMVKLFKAFNISANKVRETASTIAQLWATFQYDDFYIFIATAQTGSSFHACCHATDNYNSFCHIFTLLAHIIYRK